MKNIFKFSFAFFLLLGLQACSDKPTDDIAEVKSVMPTKEVVEVVKPIEPKSKFKQYSAEDFSTNGWFFCNFEYLKIYK